MHYFGRSSRQSQNEWNPDEQYDKACGDRHNHKKRQNIQFFAQCSVSNLPITEHWRVNKWNFFRYNQSPAVREFGFSVANEFEKIDARVLDPPRLKYANQPITPQRGVWRADRAKFLACGQLLKWTIVNLDRRTQNKALDNLAEMVRIFLNIGF